MSSKLTKGWIYNNKGEFVSDVNTMFVTPNSGREFMFVEEDGSVISSFDDGSGSSQSFTDDTGSSHTFTDQSGSSNSWTDN